MSTSVLFRTFEAGDGWPIGGLVRVAARVAGLAPGVLAVPGSRHARDAWTHTAMALVERGCTVMQIDVRGRGASANGVRYSEMGPAERRRVALDVAAAVDDLARVAGVDASRLGLLVEQDTAAEAIEAVIGDDRVRALAVLSARHSSRVATAVAGCGVPVYGMASIEDREGLRATVDAYLAAPEANSRIDVFRGLGVGITMASVLQFERPQEQRIETRLADWVIAALGAQTP